MHVCFILENKDFSKIKHGNIENLPLSIQGYIKALAKIFIGTANIYEIIL